MNASRPIRIASAALLCVSCNPGEPAHNPSLVGAKTILTPASLSRELVQINRIGAESENFLSYELRPDDTLTVSVESLPTREIVSREVFHLEPEVAAEIRSGLARVRPAEFEGVEHETRPLGCRLQGPHDFGEIAVVFVDENATSSTSDDRIGLFALPNEGNCDSPQAIEARLLLERVSGLLAKSTGKRPMLG